jgi:hypothetical protein
MLRDYTKEARMIEGLVGQFTTRVPTEMLDALDHMHRTNQQCLTRFCVAWFEYLAKKGNHYDERHEDSVKLAKEFAETMNSPRRYLPYI